jgi:hypothetical protein
MLCAEAGQRGDLVYLSRSSQAIIAVPIIRDDFHGFFALEVGSMPAVRTIEASPAVKGEPE